MAKTVVGTVVVEFAGSVSDGGLLRLEVDGKKLNVVGGRASKDVDTGIQHTLSWFVLGPAGTKYEAAIRKPQSVSFSHKDTLDEHGKDVGFHWFQV